MSWRDDVVNQALAFVGVKYVFGGNSPSGFDCSGFVKFVYQMVGMPIQGRSTDQMVRGGSLIETSAPQKGDLVFFQGTDPGQPGIQFPHVGIYLGGDEIIDASTNGGNGVAKRSLSFYQSFLTAKFYRFRNVSDTAESPTSPATQPTAPPTGDATPPATVGNTSTVEGINAELAKIDQQIADISSYKATGNPLEDLQHQFDFIKVFGLQIQRFTLNWRKFMLWVNSSNFLIRVGMGLAALALIPIGMILLGASFVPAKA